MEEVFIKILKRWWKLKQPIKFNNIEFLKNLHMFTIKI